MSNRPRKRPRVGSSSKNTISRTIHEKILAALSNSSQSSMGSITNDDQESGSHQQYTLLDDGEMIDSAVTDVEEDLEYDGSTTHATQQQGNNMAQSIN
ncbi:hypothetical protein [Parasitella parasitica]|uniref:Uncharacterized protein n=1 Tax=Parasitella parasitica TaxID=35722 RepID=A0A0B7MMI0_9FUNG|nr:hypothetical protein [Parasitella parasitica]